MKVLVTLLMVCTILCFSENACSQKSVHKFIDDIKENKSTQVVTLPGWIVRKGISLAVNDGHERGYEDIRKGIKKVRFAVSTSPSEVSSESLAKLLILAKKDGLEEYIKIKDKEGDLLVLVKEQEDYIRNLTIITKSIDNFAIVNINTKITLADLEKADFSFNKNN